MRKNSANGMAPFSWNFEKQWIAPLDAVLGSARTADPMLVFTLRDYVDANL
jgi:hypothetical protein